MNDKRNLLLAAVLSLLILVGSQFLTNRFFPTPPPAPVSKTAPVPGAPATAQAPVPGSPATPGVDAANAPRTLAVALRATPRIAIDTPRLKGTIALKGARIDDIVLPTYKQTLAKDSPPVRMFSPAGTPSAYFAGFGWSGTGMALPDANTLWTADRTTLTPTSPVTLRWDNGAGQTFLIRFSVDANYMLSIAQTVQNSGAAPVSARGFGYLSHTGPSRDPSTWTIHTGPMSAFNGAANYDVSYDNLDGKQPGFFSSIFGTKAVAGANSYQSTGGWIGFTDHYWHSALIPQQDKPVNASFRAAPGQRYQADMGYAPATIAPGKSLSITSRLFVGAKETSILEAYTDQANGVPLFDRAIDWGWFRWFEKPIFYLLDWLFRAIGNFGVAIICLTFVVRGLMFPIAQRQFASMAAMRAIQPKMKAIQEKYKDDKLKAQQEVAALYREEKVNPLTGCLPIFLQIPVFFALYKVLQLTIEIRHQPFILWIKDLSAPDPLHVLNLFGLLDFTPPSFLGIGLLAIILGASMYFQFKLNPAPMDATQQQIFAIMPWMMMFVMAGYPAGLLLYWSTSNLLTIAQQWWLYQQNPELKKPVVKAPAVKK